MTTSDRDWAAVRQLVGEALELPEHERNAYLERNCPDPVRLEAARRWLRACDRAADSSLFAAPADLAAPMFAELEARTHGIPAELEAALAGRYTIERELGRGGMATVFLARDERHGRPVALKLLRPGLVPGDGASHGAARFQREIEFAARLAHPHILPLHDSGAAGGLLYYITPYIDGETLRERLDRSGPPPLQEAVGLLRDVARALVHAHRQGIVHRDIKPGNILLTAEGDALVADFGVARGLEAASLPESSADERSPEVPDDPRLTDGILALGTPAYMAPEQVIGSRDVDHRADLYGFGVVAYEILTGAPPFAGRSRDSVMEAHLSETPLPVSDRCADVPRRLADLVERLLAKRPDDRPADTADVARELDAVIAAFGPDTGTAAAGAGRHLRLVKLLPVLAIPLLWSSAATREPTASLPVADDVGTADPAAHELFLKGRLLVATRQREGLERGIVYLDSAVARDPDYARAHAALADAWIFRGIFGHIPNAVASERGRVAALRALEIDSLLVEAHAALAHKRFVLDWDWEGADTDLLRAISLGPRYPLLRMFRASFLHSVGRSEEALEQLAAAREIDPLARTGIFAGRVYVDMGRFDEAIDVLEEEVTLEPRLDLAHEFLAHAYLGAGRPEDAVASMRTAAVLSGARDSVLLAYVYARTGDAPEARRVLDAVRSDGRPLEKLGLHLGMAYGALGDRDEAFRWLEIAYASRGAYMNLLGVLAGFEDLRPDPRFQDILRRMGLAEVIPRG